MSNVGSDPTPARQEGVISWADGRSLGAVADNIRGHLPRVASVLDVLRDLDEPSRESVSESEIISTILAEINESQILRR